MAIFSKTNPRRTKVRKSRTTERLARLMRFVNAEMINSFLIWFLFIVAAIVVITFEDIQKLIFVKDVPASTYKQVISVSILVILSTLFGSFYVHQFQNRVVQNYIRGLALSGLFILFLIITKFGSLLGNQTFWATGSAVAVAIIMAISYSQRFALGMSGLYCLLAGFAAEPVVDFNLFFTMAAGAVTCCFSLKEVRTRMKLLEVSTFAAVAVFVSSVTLSIYNGNSQAGNLFRNAGYHAGAAFLAGLLIQSLLPVIEKVFRIATSMTLLDYSDANQPLLKRLAMEAPGTFSHCLLVGTIAEAAAEAIGANGLLCRVGAYYHDIGKLNKPLYFTENELGDSSRHKELSPAMSQLIIVGHVKDGIEMAKEYGLPVVLRQFIETHHGTTLIEYFYNEAKKKTSGKQGPPSESEFRYTGPRPKSKEAAIVMLADSCEGAVRSLSEATPIKIENVVHNLAIKRLQDNQLDDCDLSLRELSQIETSLSKSLAAHYHGRVAYPKRLDIMEKESD